MHRPDSLIYHRQKAAKAAEDELCCCLQFHTWLTTGIPDGQPKMLLTFLPYEDYPLLNFGMATASKSCLHLSLCHVMCLVMSCPLLCT